MPKITQNIDKKVKMKLAKPVIGWSALVFEGIENNIMDCYSLSYVGTPHLDIIEAVTEAITDKCKVKVGIDGEGSFYTYVFKHNSIEKRHNGITTKLKDIDLKDLAKGLITSVNDNFEDWVMFECPENEEEREEITAYLKGKLEELNKAIVS